MKIKSPKNTSSDFSVKPGFTIRWESYDTIRPQLLETFDYEYAGRDTTVTIDTDEFTSVCPWSGLPDYANIIIEYVPGKKIIELRSLKYYLYTFRNVGIFQEHLTQRILDDLVQCCQPKNMTVTTDYNIRGGIHTTCQASYSQRKK